MNNCKFCDVPTSYVNDAGEPVCPRCETVIKNNPEVTDELAYVQVRVCNHPKPWDAKGCCKFCGKVMEDHYVKPQEQPEAWGTSPEDCAKDNQDERWR